jgi:hypothetical protein
LHAAAKAVGTTPEGLIARIAAEAVRGVDPEWRPFMQDALRLHAYNADLSVELGAVMIRHRRTTGHRCVRVGAEFSPGDHTLPLVRPDAHLLHGAPGIDVKGDGELAHYLLMKCVTELKRVMGKSGRSSLGSDLTGCYTTLQCSAEGKKIASLLRQSPVGARYLKLLSSMITKGWDAKHPKIMPVVEQTLENWRHGEKTLIFCFRVNTAERLAEILETRIGHELERRQNDCLGGSGNLDALKKRLTSRRTNLIGVGLDRVLWSLVAWQDTRLCVEQRLQPADLELTDSDLRELARVSLKHGEPVHGEHLDRVFLTRATEHVLAVRLLARRWPRCIQRVLREMATPGWITHPYGLHNSRSEDASAGEQPEFDERGVHEVYEANDDAPAATRVDELWETLKASRTKSRQSRDIPVLDVYTKGPNLWLGARPADGLSARAFALAGLQRHLWALTGVLDMERPLNWESRRKVMQAMRRAVLKGSVLARLLPTREEREESRWDVLLVDAFLKPMEGQSESFADRLTVFLEDLEAAGGDLAAKDESQRGMRSTIYDSTRLTDKFVALVKGGGGSGVLEQRTRLFTGFNTPLLPEVLVCTQVGQEGIDLHRHCRHVIHYDLAWNPAVMEQRTGRTDRIGSKTFREIERAKGTAVNPKLEVGVPYLAATYDERMYEELRLRAQAFEVLTGGDFSGDNPEGKDDEPGAEGKELGGRLVPLPEEMTHDLRVNLHIFRDDGH